MPVYDYKCNNCGAEESIHVSAYSKEKKAWDEGRVKCTCLTGATYKRVFGFSFEPMMHEHFNKSVGKPISSMRQYKDELKRASEEAYAKTGIEHNFVPVDMNDAKAVGATNEGIDESNRVRSARGEPLLPEIK